MSGRLAKAVLIIVCSLSLTACAAGSGKSPFGPSAEVPNVLAPGGSLKMGKIHFENGDYGLAEKHFRHAVERSPDDVNAWIGLAASYDHLRRFKLSERAYAQAIQINGKTTLILNNMGYSYLLRGNKAKAREHFLAASEKDPENIQIRNNISMLENSNKLALLES